jgi:hypothetical protein
MSGDSGEMFLERSDPAASSGHEIRWGGACGTAIAGVVVLIIHSALVAVGIGEAATVVVSVLFGLWHVAAEAQRTGALGPGVVPGVMATATASALVLCPLRRRTGDLAAPVAVHAATNMSVFVAVFHASRAAG